MTSSVLQETRKESSKPRVKRRKKKMTKINKIKKHKEKSMNSKTGSLEKKMVNLRSDWSQKIKRKKINIPISRMREAAFYRYYRFLQILTEKYNYMMKNYKPINGQTRYNGQIP